MKSYVSVLITSFPHNVEKHASVFMPQEFNCCLQTKQLQVSCMIIIPENEYYAKHFTFAV